MSANAFVSLFTGAGGLDIGLEAAGWSCRYACDLDRDAVETLKLNQGRRIGNFIALEHACIERAEVRTLNGRKIFAKSGLRKGEAELLAGGPPCQSWSSAGHQNGFKDPRGQLFADFVRIANELDVRWLVFENVRGLLTARGEDGVPGSALQLIRTHLLNAGFQTTVNLLNAADYGVSQRRVRLIVVGYRTGDAPPAPPPTHASIKHRALGRWGTLGSCIQRLKLSESEIIRPSGALAEELRLVEPGSGVKSPGKVETTRPGGHWGYKQGAFIAELGLPARTVTASGQQDWIKDPVLGLRRLCPRECAKIQSFPSDWEFVGNRASQYRQIGNAVPPRLADAIGAALRDHVSSQSQERVLKHIELLPLPAKLAQAVKYTEKEEVRNGWSRKIAPRRRIARENVTGIEAC